MAKKRTTKAKTANKVDAGIILLVDVGNSRVKWAHAANGTPKDHASAPRPRAADVEIWADEHWGAYPPPRTVVIANVADADFAREPEDIG